MSQASSANGAILTSPKQIAVPGRNCWRVEHASRAAFLIDASAYFTAFAQAVENARHTIFIIAWDIHSRARRFAWVRSVWPRWRRKLDSYVSYPGPMPLCPVYQHEFCPKSATSGAVTTIRRLRLPQILCHKGDNVGRLCQAGCTSRHSIDSTYSLCGPALSGTCDHRR